MLTVFFWLPSQHRIPRRASIFSVESSMIHSIDAERFRNGPQTKIAISAEKSIANVFDGLTNGF
jgi:hypothetical protein